MSVEQTKPQIVEEAVQESKRGKTRYLLFGLMILTLASLIFSGVAAYKAYKPVQEQAQAGTDLAQQVQAACSDPEKNTKDLRGLCDDADNVVESKPDAVEGPQGDQGDPGSTGVQGPPPSAAQVANAVASYCTIRNNCVGAKGATGATGATGASVTQAQVAEAVAAFCNAQGECRGPSGAAGSPGQDGAPGGQGEAGPAGPQGETGPQGDPPTDAQIEGAVLDYCSANDGCKGDPGPTGVVAVDTQGCGQQEGNVIDSVTSTYDADTRTITITCTQVPNTLIGQGGPG